MSHYTNSSNRNKLIIYNIDPIYTTDYIIEVLYIQHIAKVSRIILVPYISKYDGEEYLSAYIDVHEWNNNEYAQGFIQLLKSLSVSKNYCVYLYHYNDLKWPVVLTYDTNVAFNLGHTKTIAVHYSLEHYKNKTEDWDNDSDMMDIVRNEFIAKQCAENVLEECK